MGELRCELNPGLDEFYLDALNTAFDGWGERELYEWVFERKCGSFAPDQMILNDGDEILAGSGVSYRKFGRAEDAIDVGIMTGSWTLPAARGRGCFKRIIDESVSISKERGCGLLLAFVTHDNPSRYALEKAGSALFESRYLFASECDIAPLDVAETQEKARDLFDEHEKNRADSNHFVYPNFEDFAGQILERAYPVELVSVGDARVFVEKTSDTDRVASLLLNGESPDAVFQVLAARAASAGRKFFAFQMRSTPVKYLDSKAGFLTALVADPDALASFLDVDSEWNGESGHLADPKSDWYLGRLRIDSGDRM